jgi:hypothetical protein
MKLAKRDEDDKRQAQKIYLLEHDQTLTTLELKMERSKEATKSIIENRQTFAAIRDMNVLLGEATQKIRNLDTVNKSLLEQLGEKQTCSVCMIYIGSEKCQNPGEESSEAQTVLSELDQQFRLLNSTMGMDNWDSSATEDEAMQDFNSITNDLTKSFTMLNDIVLKPTATIVGEGAEDTADKSASKGTLVPAANQLGSSENIISVVDLTVEKQRLNKEDGRATISYDPPTSLFQ